MAAATDAYGTGLHPVRHPRPPSSRLFAPDGRPDSTPWRASPAPSPRRRRYRLVAPATGEAGAPTPTSAAPSSTPCARVCRERDAQLVVGAGGGGKPWPGKAASDTARGPRGPRPCLPSSASPTGVVAHFRATAEIVSWYRWSSPHPVPQSARRRHPARDRAPAGRRRRQVRDRCRRPDAVTLARRPPLTSPSSRRRRLPRLLARRATGGASSPAHLVGHRRFAGTRHRLAPTGATASPGPCHRLARLQILLFRRTQPHGPQGSCNAQGCIPTPPRVMPAPSLPATENSV